MLTTIEVEIDREGRIRPLEPLPYPLSGRAYLTLLPASPTDLPESDTGRSTAAAALALLASPRFSPRPAADAREVQERIAELREDWERNG